MSIEILNPVWVSLTSKAQIFHPSKTPPSAYKGDRTNMVPVEYSFMTQYGYHVCKCCSWFDWLKDNTA